MYSYIHVRIHMYVRLNIHAYTHIRILINIYTHILQIHTFAWDNIFNVIRMYAFKHDVSTSTLLNVQT